MDIGIGLNATVPGVERAELLGWARRAEERGFTSLGIIDRLIYPNWEPLVAFAAAAAVTERIALVASILIAPYRETALLAKQVATLDQLSGGRLALGVGLGSREDDYEVIELDAAPTGARLERQLEEMRRIWGGEKLGHAGAIGPTPVRVDGPPIVVGGAVEAAFDRAARLGIGWIMGGGAPERFRDMAAGVAEAWARHGRPGRPRLLALSYFSLGEEAERDARAYLGDYYAWLGEETATAIAGSAATDAETVQRHVAAFEQAGCDELILCPCNPEPGQVDLLADACGL